MAEKKNLMRTEKTSETGRQTKESVYPARELVKAAHRFHTQEECVAAALSFYGKKEATMKEAEELVRKFLKREVK